MPADTVQSWYYVSARATSVDEDAQSDVLRHTQDILRNATIQYPTPEPLYQAHVAACRALQVSGLYVQDNLDVAQAINASLYSLRTTVRADVMYSTSPGGLATNGYSKHAVLTIPLDPAGVKGRRSARLL